MESGEVDGGGLLVAGGDVPPLFEAVDAAFDGVALLVGLTVEGGWPAAVAAASLAAGLLVGRDRDRRPDPAASQVSPDRAGRRGLVGRTASGLVRGLPSGRGTRTLAMTCSKAGAPPACPGVRTELSPPRDRPRAWSPGSSAGALCAGPGHVRVRAHHGRVDRDRPLQVFVRAGLGEQGGEDTFPGAADRPVPVRAGITRLVTEPVRRAIRRLPERSGIPLPNRTAPCAQALKWPGRPDRSPDRLSRGHPDHVRREHLHPGAQLSLFDLDEGMRHQVFLTASGHSHAHLQMPGRTPIKRGRLPA